ncbi:MAG: hypothetical protein JW801_01440 [Bacteroidales bacterium]|nr:hypothetical protein [Bacteroidales bacterium]
MKSAPFISFSLLVVMTACFPEENIPVVTDVTNARWSYNYEPYETWVGSTLVIQFLPDNELEIYGVAYEVTGRWQVEDACVVISDLDTCRLFDSLPDYMYEMDARVLEYLGANRFMALEDSNLYIERDIHQPVFKRTVSLPTYCLKAHEALSGDPDAFETPELNGSWVLTSAYNGWGTHWHYPDSLIITEDHTYRMYMEDCQYETGSYTVDSLRNPDETYTQYFVRFTARDKGTFTQTLGFDYHKHGTILELNDLPQKLLASTNVDAMKYNFARK